MNSWQEAFNTIEKPDEVDPEIKQRQREIKQAEWDNDLPNFGDQFDEISKIKKMLRESKWAIDGETPSATIHRMIQSYNDVNNQLHSVKQALRK